MKRRIRSIFILMTICILGIIGFQTYWLYNAYRLASEQFMSSVNDALRDAIGRKGFKDVKEFSEAHPEMMAVRDSMSRRAGWYFISEKLKDEPYRLEELDTLYKKELEEREVNAAYTIDTMRSSRRTSRGKRFHSKQNSMQLETRSMRVNPTDNLTVKASFTTPYQFLFNRLLGVLIVSFLLLALTIASFIYMLNTILKQKKLSEIKNDFVNNMTHELKTPIATVSAAIEALRHFRAMDNKEKAQSYLAISHRELERLSGLVEKVLYESVEGDASLVIHRQPVGIGQLLDDVIEGQKLKSEKKITFQIQNELKGEKFSLDPLHFSNALNNIIDNAVKYSAREVQVQIDVKKDAHGGLHLTFSDNGMGIPASYKKLIFDKFFRVPTGDLHQVKGFGLGLSYVKNVITKHGGTVTVESETGKGSTFTIIIP